MLQPSDLGKGRLLPEHQWVIIAPSEWQRGWGGGTLPRRVMGMNAPRAVSWCLVDGKDAVVGVGGGTAGWRGRGGCCKHQLPTLLAARWGTGHFISVSGQ